MPPELTSISGGAEQASFVRPTPTAARPSPSDVLVGYRDEQCRINARLGMLAQRATVERDAEVDTLVDQQYARVSAACDVQADSVAGVMAKLDIWYIERLTDGLDKPEDEVDRLAASARNDLRRLLGAAD